MCSVIGCFGKQHARALCRIHYQRLYYSGSLELKAPRCVDCGVGLERKGPREPVRCAACVVKRKRERQRADYAAHRTKRLAAQAARRARDPESARQRGRGQWAKASSEYKRRVNAGRNARRVCAAVVERYDPRSVFERDGWVCYLCGFTIDESLRFPDPLSASIDHLEPLSRGGSDALDNVGATHLRCNMAKGNRAL
jgi:hypothetical protein